MCPSDLVGASLLANAVYQSHQCWLRYCFREQARSHMDMCSQGDVVWWAYGLLVIPYLRNRWAMAV